MTAELTESQLAQMRQTLEALKVSLQASLEGLTQGAKPVDLDEPIGRLSRMDAMQQQHMASANTHKQKIRLSRVRAALTRLDKGNFGLCRECEEPITVKRLMVRPESQLCLSCQSDLENS